MSSDAKQKKGSLPDIKIYIFPKKQAEREGFEPSAANNDCSGFRDRPVRPLRHLSVCGYYSILKGRSGGG